MSIIKRIKRAWYKYFSKKIYQDQATCLICGHFCDIEELAGEEISLCPKCHSDDVISLEGFYERNT